MATVYYNITYGDPPFTVNITGEGIDITEAVGSTGIHYFTDLADGNYVIIVTSDVTGCRQSIEVEVDCITTTTTTAEPTTTTTTTCYVYVEIISLCEEITPPSTSTTTSTSTIPPTTTTTTTNLEEVTECLDGFEIEAIYIASIYDYSLLPPQYVHPCYNKIGSHRCNRALFEVFGNGVYVGDMRMNNKEGVGGGVTANSGNQICQDYTNLPHDLTGGFWGGTDLCRYDKITLTHQQAMDIAVATGGSTFVTFSLVAAMDTYGASCDGQGASHDNVTWIRMTSPGGTVLYNGCPDGNFVTLDVCSGAVLTTTTTTLPVNTYFVYYDVL